MQLRELVAKYETGGSFSSEAVSAFSQENVYSGLDYSSQYEAYQAQRAGLLSGMDYGDVNTTGVTLMTDSSKVSPQTYTDPYAQPQLPAFSRSSGPSFEVDERYQVAGPEPTYGLTSETPQAYVGYNPVSLDSGNGR